MPSNPEQTVEKELRGTARAVYRLEGRWSLSFLTKGWTDEEKQNLRDGDPEARDALKSVLFSCVRATPDECETDDFELVIEKEATHA